MGLQCEDITKAVIGAAFAVHDVLGFGFLEKVYQRAMIVELRSRGVLAMAETEIPGSTTKESRLEFTGRICGSKSR